MTSVATEALLKRFPDFQFELYDYNEARLHALFGKQASHYIQLKQLDLYNGNALLQAIEGSDLVINGAGPFYRTTEIVAKACIAAKTNYLDICDDIESTQAAINLNQQAIDAGIGLFVGCGASPGLTSLLAADLIYQLDEVDDIEVAWVVGDEGPQEAGKAVLEHVLHIGAGDCLTWRNHQPYIATSFAESKTVEMGGELGAYRLYECAHPETVMLPYSFPHIKNAYCWGGMHPQAVNGVVKGIAQAYQQKSLSEDEAHRFLADLLADRNGHLKGWKYAFKGMMEQLRKGENQIGSWLGFLGKSLLKQHPPTLSGVMAQAHGKKGKQPVILRRCLPNHPSYELSSNMASATGLPQAAFASHILTLDAPPKGTVFPERIATLSEIETELVKLGVAPHEISSELVCLSGIDC